MTSAQLGARVLMVTITRRDQLGLTPDQAERNAWRERPGRSRHNPIRRLPA
jgi:hypothetical protein